MTGLGFLWIVFFSLVIFLYGCQSIDSKRQILVVTLWFNIFLWLHITLSLNSLTWHTVSLMISLLPVSSLASVYSSTFMQRFRLRWLLVAHWIYNVILYAVCSFILEAVLLFFFTDFYWSLILSSYAIFLGSLPWFHRSPTSALDRFLCFTKQPVHVS